MCDYTDAYVLVTGDIAVTRGDRNTKVAFKNCHSFTKCRIHLNDDYVEDSTNLDITMTMYNLIEYSDNYEDFTACLYQFKRQEQSYDNANPTDIVDLTADNLSSFKYKSGFLGTTENQITANDNPDIPLSHRLWRNVKIIFPLKYVSSFFRSLERPLINAKLYIQLGYTRNSVYQLEVV